MVSPTPPPNPTLQQMKKKRWIIKKLTIYIPLISAAPAPKLVVRVFRFQAWASVFSGISHRQDRQPDSQQTDRQDRTDRQLFYLLLLWARIRRVGQSVSHVIARSWIKKIESNRIEPNRNRTETDLKPKAPTTKGNPVFQRCRCLWYIPMICTVHTLLFPLPMVSKWVTRVSPFIIFFFFSPSPWNKHGSTRPHSSCAVSTYSTVMCIYVQSIYV